MVRNICGPCVNDLLLSSLRHVLFLQRKWGWGPNRCDTGLPVYQSLHALVGLNMFIVLSSVMTCIKCRLSSSLFFLWLTLTFQWEFNFNGSLNIAGVREMLNFVCALDAMVRKLISLICFDIFQSKWYRNALIGVPDDKTNSEKRLLWQTTCLIEKCGRIQSGGYFN